MNPPVHHAIVMADIEGSSGCWSYDASAFCTKAWAAACLAMSQDVAAVVNGLRTAGVDRVTVYDFHRTGYNLLPELIPGARVVQGFCSGLVPGMGAPASDADALLLVGMHAASGTPGFLAHTLTSRIQSIRVSGKPLPEVALFSAALAPFGIRPVFFSGCPEACRQAAATVRGIHTFSIDKSDGPDRFDPVAWRMLLADAVASAVASAQTLPLTSGGPLTAVVTLREGAPAARRWARRWDLGRDGGKLLVPATDLIDLYWQLARICYLTPLTRRCLPIGLMLNNLKGRLGLAWVRRRLAKTGGYQS